MRENNLWAPIIGVWKVWQTGLLPVTRWSKYITDERFGSVRKQDSLQHSYSITILGKIVISKLRRHMQPINETLLLSALLIHDLGEVQNGDIHYIDKSENYDLREYEAFMSMHKCLDVSVREELQEAFLLQFANKCPGNFPVQARLIMEGLAQEYPIECLMFEAIERWDYLLYALEQFYERKNDRILVQTLRNQISKLDLLATNLPGFEIEIWTKEVSMICHSYVESLEGEFVEVKSLI